jgi:hypothetical protein
MSNEKNEVDLLKSELISLLKENEYIGIDVDLEISLFEYNFVYNSENNTMIYSKYYYDMDEQNIDNYEFNIFIIEESELDEIFEENEVGICSFTGNTKSEWLNTSVQSKIIDIHMYCGLDFDINTYTFNELIEWLNIKKN